MNTKLSNTKIWTGTHKSVKYEIRHNTSEYDGAEHWTYYLYIELNKIPVEHKPNSYWLRGKKWNDHIMYDYYKHNILSNLEWHCGITYYNKEYGFDGNPKVIKVGCDYAHYWDEGHTYYLQDIERDVEKTIEDFLTRIPNYKYWCMGNGKYYELKDGVMNERGTFYSNEYLSKKE